MQKKKLKVLIVQPWIRQGGAELMSVHLAHNLQRLGNQVMVACLFVDLEDLPRFTSELNFKKPPKFVSDFFKKHRKFTLIFGSLFMFWLVLKNGSKVDIFNPHNLPSYWIASMLKPIFKKPVVWTCNEPPTKLPPKDIKRIGPIDFLIWLVASSFIDKFFVRNIDEIIVLSKKTQKQLKQIYRRDSVVVYYGEDFDFFSKNSGIDLAKKYKLSANYVLFTAGKIYPQKNQESLIEALLQVVNDIQGIKLVISGEGPQKRYLEERVKTLGLKKNILFVGFSPTNRVRSWYHVCDLVLFPAVNQSWGMVPFEALCAKKISIVANDSGAAEVISKHKIGLICEPKPEELAKQILFAYKNRRKIEDMGQKGFEFVKKYLSWERYASESLLVFRKAYEKKLS